MKKRFKGTRSRSNKDQGHGNLFSVEDKLKDLFEKKLEYRLGVE